MESVPTVNEAGQLSSRSLGKAGVPQGPLEARLALQLLVQRPDGLLCLPAPGWLWIREGENGASLITRV